MTMHKPSFFPLHEAVTLTFTDSD